jgi:hypothetical protein
MGIAANLPDARKCDHQREDDCHDEVRDMHSDTPTTQTMLLLTERRLLSHLEWPLFYGAKNVRRTHELAFA